MPAASLNALLTNSIDYAGMFPPCSLGLEPALKNHAQYVRSADSWMLGGFVLPIEQFDAAKQLLSEFDLYIRCASRRSDRRPRQRTHFWTRSTTSMHRFARSRDTMSISYRLTTSKCFYRLMLILEC